MIDLLNVLVATIAAFAMGAFWYGMLSEPWMDAAGIQRDENGQPQGGMNPGLMAFGFICTLLVAGMMRHVFELGGIDTLGKGLVGGIGIGLFFITPWLALNYAFAMRPFKLTLIDGGYATVACAIMGLVLTLF